MVQRAHEFDTVQRGSRHIESADRSSNVTLPEAFLKFILANEAVTCVIPATNKLEHLRDNMSAARARLPDAEERKKLIAVLNR